MRHTMPMRVRTCLFWLLTLVFVTVMSGCHRATYFCENGKTIEAIYQREGEQVVIDVDDGAFTLPKIPADSGTKYGDSTRSFWFKGNELIVEAGGTYPFGRCVSPQ